MSVRAASSNNTDESKYDMLVSSMTSIVHNLIVFYSCISSTHRPGSDATAGERSILKFSYDHARSIYQMHRNEGESVSTYPRRPGAEASSDAVDVVELLRDPTDQAPNVRHLRVQHTFSLMTSFAFLIQQDGEVVDEFRQHDCVVTVMVKLSPKGFA